MGLLVPHLDETVGQALSPANPALQDQRLQAAPTPSRSRFGKRGSYLRMLPNRDRQGVGAFLNQY